MSFYVFYRVTPVNAGRGEYAEEINPAYEGKKYSGGL